MSAKELYVAIWFLTCVIVLHAQPFTCTNQNGHIVGAPRIPVMANSYQSSVEIKILDKNYSITVDEYLDYNGNRARLTAYDAGSIEKIIYLFGTNEVLDVIDQNCNVSSIESARYNFLYGPFANNKSEPDQRRNFGSASMLRYATNSHSVYNGTGSVRGIPADIWTTCLQLPSNQGVVKVTYYFSKVGWSTSSRLTQVPLRVEVEGMYASASVSGSATTAMPKNPSYIHHIHDFTNYLPNIEADSSIFLTPHEVVCLNRKSTKNLPQFSSYFKYKAEIVDSTDSYITYYAIWYDEDYKLLREDTRKIVAQDGTTASTITEIHDFNTGLRYIIDHSSGCTVQSIEITDTDGDSDVVRFHFNGSLVVDIRDPNGFFFLNSNYTYTGQRIIRGMPCDIFNAIIPDYVVQAVKINATFEYAFLAGNWSYLTLNGMETNVQKYPVQLQITDTQIGYSRVYNFFEFAEDHSTYPIFDVTSCFDEKQKLGFKLTFPGSFSKGSLEQWTSSVYNLLIDTMNLFPTRVGGIGVTSDDDNVYVNAYVVAASSSAQFVHNNISLEYQDDKLIKGILMPDECADLCASNADFHCESYQYCQFDGYACRLSKAHTPTNGVPRNATACDNYARTVKVSFKKEPLLRDAIISLETAAFQGSVQAVIKNNAGTGSTTFTALGVQLISGQIMHSKPLPVLPTAFFYRLEIAVSKTNNVQETYVWFDQDMSLVRYDNRDTTSDTPVYTIHIHDFNLGVAYQINQVTQECTEAPIASSEVFDVTTGTTTRNGALVVSMKSAQALFFLDDTYIYVGQGTARGILCDVYESRRNDFDLEYYNMSSEATVFKYYFQVDNWDYNSPQADIPTQNQPIQLNIEDKSTGDFLIYNFYDFAEQHYAASFYDASSCYSTEEKKSFIIAFKNQPFHPNLDGLSNTFLNTAIIQLAEFTFTSPIYFQESSLTYDNDNVYIITTALGHTSPLNLFSPVMKVAHNTTNSQSFATVAEDCAEQCIETTTYICNSFDYCQDIINGNCILGIKHAESEGDPSSSSGPCTHYSRTENGTYPGMSVKKMYDTITDYVYDNKFKVTVNLQNGTSVTYLATNIRDDVLTPDDPGSTSNSMIQKFVITPGFQFNKTLVILVYTMISITDCAMNCLQENTFECQSFDYQFSIGTCRLSDKHPDELVNINASLSRNDFTSIYSRFYTADYTKFNGEVFGTHPDKIISNTPSDEICARACTSNTDFRCESFEICSDGSCMLRKTHILQARPKDLTQNPDCVHYSRNHIFDYILREHKVIQGHDDVMTLVNNASECAQLCANGEGLPSCASFELCQIQEGDTTCTLSLADPTSQHNLNIVDRLQCSLYTLANSPRGAVTTVTPASGAVTTVTPASAGTGTAITSPAVTKFAGSSPAVTNLAGTSPAVTNLAGTSPAVTNLAGTSPAVTNLAGSSPAVTNLAGTSPGVTNHAGTSPAVTTTSGNPGICKSYSSPDTDIRIGIAFGTLFFGMLLGAVIMFTFSSYRVRISRKQDDATMLSNYTQS